MCYGQPNYLQLTYAHGNGATNAEWTFPSGWSYSSLYGTTVGLTPYSTGYANLTVKVANSCGWALYPVGFGVNVNHCYSGFSAGNGYKVYPNPTDDVLHIEFEHTEELPEEIALFNSVGEKVAEADMKQKAKDMEFKAQKKITFDVKKLPKGTYYLHIVSKEQVDKKQILIGISSSTSH
ncbi:T9SS type A sorting domain-containing protein [Thermoflexibacter ruber]|uniref:Por secretion system C-terminal sorting domain-containing protein n=1 Tax=Thermoflexibacter ruber TaxID=1003 RepID=A0A1I2J2V5_9BACT|nr:T9SS type A sorting domain-containing protein [Thermoflexibacter ruber]SFF48759.1 Por secretion system C-terminal sorting domain-containing protein [Thermoflexibacter ruber]